MSSINTAELAAKLGDYYRQYRPILNREMLLGFDPNRTFTVLDDIKDELPLPELEVGSIVQPGNALEFNPTANAINFKARILKVRDWKVDLNLVPKVMEKVWLGQWAPKGSQPQRLPFHEAIMQYIIERIHDDLRNFSVFRGTYDPNIKDAIHVMNGLLTLVADEITATNITPVATGPITQPDVEDKLLAVHDSLSEACQAKETIMIVSSQIFNWYVRKYQQIVNPSITATVFHQKASGARVNEFPLEGTNCTLLREPGFGTSQRVICTPKSNLYYGVDTLGEENNMDFQKFNRSLKILIDAKAGVQISMIQDSVFAVNDQA